MQTMKNKNEVSQRVVAGCDLEIIHGTVIAGLAYIIGLRLHISIYELAVGQMENKGVHA